MRVCVIHLLFQANIEGNKCYFERELELHVPGHFVCIKLQMFDEVPMDSIIT